MQRKIPQSGSSGAIVCRFIILYSRKVIGYSLDSYSGHVPKFYLKSHLNDGLGGYEMEESNSATVLPIFFTDITPSGCIKKLH